MSEKRLSYTLKLLFILLFIHGQYVAHSFQPVSQDLKVKAIEWFNTGDFQRALPVFTKLVYDFPYDYLVKYYAGASLVETGDYGKEAEKNLLLASGNDVPVRVWYYLGRFYHALENWNSAQRYYNRFRNNAGPADVSELRIDELSQFCFDHINPFASAEKGDLPPAVIPGPDQPKDDAEVQEVKSQPVPVPLQQETKSDTIKVESDKLLTGTENIPVSALKEKSPKDTVAAIIHNEVKTEVTEKPVQKPESPPVVQSGQATEIRKVIPATPESRPDSSSLVSKRTVAAESKSIEFRINERVTYLITLMFQEAEALKEFQTAEEKSSLLDSLLREVDRLRTKFHTTLAPGVRDSLAKKIRAAEFSNLTLKNEMDAHYAKAAAIENLWWKDAGLGAYESFMHARDSLLQLKLKAASSPQTDLAIDTAKVMAVQAAIPDSAAAKVRKEEKEGTPVPEKNAGNGLIFKVQLGICDKTISPQRKKLLDKIAKIRPVENYINERGNTVCTTGNLTSYEDALMLQNQIRQEGIKDAFVIALKNGKRVSLPAEIGKKP